MNRDYNKEGLLKMYQSEASNTRDRKFQEKQDRVIEERRVLEKINQEIEKEKMSAHNQKIQRINQRQDEYNQMMVRQQEDKENNRSRFKGKNEYSGTFKIGGENREIKVKNYDEISKNLVLNPTREVISNEVRGRSQIENRDARIIQRGKSQGYNIINHSNPDNFSHGQNPNNVTPHNNQRQLPGQSNVNHANYGNYTNYANPNSRINTENQYNHAKEITNLAKPSQQSQMPQHYEPEEYGKNNYPYNDNQNQAEQFDDPEFQKYYEEYLRQKLREEEESSANISKPQNQMQPSTNNHHQYDHQGEREIPTGLHEYEAYRNQHLNDEINNYNNSGSPNYVIKMHF